MTRQLQITVDCADPVLLAQFWVDVLGYDVEEPPDGYQSWAEYSAATGGVGEEWSAVVDPGGVGPRLLFQRVPEGKVVKNRLHLDVRVGGPRGTPVERRRPLIDAEASRLAGAGAVHLRTVEDESDYFAVLQDPEGNEFCLC